MTTTIRVTLDNKLASRDGNRLRYNLVLSNRHTFTHVMMKMRRILKNIEASEGLYLFVDGMLPPNTKLLGSYGKSEIKAQLMVENSFGSWDKIYIRSEIKQLADNCYIATIYYKYYWYSNFNEKKYFTSKAQAREWILTVRTNSCLIEKDLKSEEKMPFGVIVENENTTH